MNQSEHSSYRCFQLKEKWAMKAQCFGRLASLLSDAPNMG